MSSPSIRTTVHATPGSVESSGVVVVDVADLGATYALDFDQGRNLLLIGTVTEDCEISFANAEAGCEFTLQLTQDATGDHVVTLPNGGTVTAAADEISTVVGYMPASGLPRMWEVGADEAAANGCLLKIRATGSATTGSADHNPVPLTARAYGPAEALVSNRLVIPAGTIPAGRQASVRLGYQGLINTQTSSLRPARINRVRSGVTTQVGFQVNTADDGTDERITVVTPEYDALDGDEFYAVQAMASVSGALTSAALSMSVELVPE